MSLVEFHYSGLSKVISGGQMGSDYGGLVAAKSFNIHTGGMAPQNWKTCAGPKPSLATDFGLQESSSPLYNIRTKANVLASDATLIVASNLQSPGTALTRRICQLHKKPFFQLQVEPESRFTGKEVYDEENYPWVTVDFLKEQNVTVLNVAGNRDKHGSYHQDRTMHFLTLVFEALKFENKLITKT